MRKIRHVLCKCRLVIAMVHYCAVMVLCFVMVTMVTDNLRCQSSMNGQCMMARSGCKCQLV